MTSPAAIAAGLRERLRARELLLGTFLKLPATDLLDLTRRAGFDFAVVDLEHSQLDEGQARMLLRHAHEIDFPTLVRLPVIESGTINRMLEAGAIGIQAPHMQSVSETRALLAATRYPPEGERSISLTHPAAGYGAEGLSSYLDRYRPGPFLVGQIETAGTEDPLEKILAGIDVAFIGALDLSLDLGTPGDLTSETFRARVTDIAHAAQSADVALGGWAAGPPQARTLIDAGATYVLVGTDISLYIAGSSAAVAELRS